jgi:hypothetical protein
MITKYDKYNIIQEKSLLNFLKLDSDFVRYLYTKLKLKENMHWVSISVDEYYLDDIRHEIKRMTNEDAFIINLKDNITLFVIKNLNNDRYDMYSNRYNTEDFVSLYTNYNLSYSNFYISEFLERLELFYNRHNIINTYLLMNIFRKNTKTEYYLGFEDFNRLFSEKYLEFEIRLHEIYVKFFKDLIKKNKKEVKYIQDLKNDIDKIMFGINIMKQNKKISIDRLEFNKIINKIKEKYKIDSIKESDINIVNDVLKEMLILFHVKNCSSLKYFKYYKWNRKLEKDNTFYTKIKNEINDPLFLKKWKHLDNATNFDLI